VGLIRLQNIDKYQDISRTPPSPEHLIILTYITNIGCGISAIFLSITLLTYLAFR